MTDHATDQAQRERAAALVRASGTEEMDVLCDRCGTDDWRVTLWPGWAECSWCGHRQEVGDAA